MLRFDDDAASRWSRTGPQAPEDPELIRACLDGEAEAWDQLIQRHGRLITSICSRYRLSAADSDDVFQAVCITLLQKLPTLADHSRLTGWLAAIAHRKCLDFLDLQKRRWASEVSDEEGALEIPDEQPTPERALANLEQQHELRLAIERLPDRCRQLIEALYYDRTSPSYEEIARRLNMSANSLGPTRARCLARLRELLDG